MKRSKVLTSAVRVLILFVFSITIPFIRVAHAEEPLKITPSLFDYGLVEEGQTITATTTIENKGNNVVEITNVRTN